MEPGFFLALSVSVPSSRKPGKEGEQVRIIITCNFMSGEISTEKNDIVKVEWRPEDVSDSVLLAVLQRAYDMFHLFQVGTPTYGFQIVNLLARIKSRVNCQRLKQLEVMREFEKQPTTFSHDTSLP